MWSVLTLGMLDKERPQLSLDCQDRFRNDAKVLREVKNGGIQTSWGRNIKIVGIIYMECPESYL